MKLNIVPARTGITWVKLGIQTFFKQPLALAGLFFMFMSVVILLSLLPFVGMVIGSMLVPASTLGLMAATLEATKGKFPMPSILVSAFRAGRQRARAMLVLGALYAAGSLLVVGIVSLAGGGQARDAGASAAAFDPPMLLALALHFPLFLAFWHAPALVHWHGVPPVKSLFFSFVACVRNFKALVVFGLLWLMVFTGVGMVLSIVFGLLGGTQMAQGAMMPLALLMAAMFSTSIYFTFRDSFTQEPPPVPSAPPEHFPGPTPGDQP